MLTGKSPKLIFGLVAFAIYVLMIGLLLFYFNTHNDIKSKHYVKKNEHRIQVTLSAPQKKKEFTPAKPKKKKNIKKPKKTIIKPIKKKSKTKKIIKEKVIKKSLKKKDETNSTKPTKNKKITKKKKIKKVHHRKVKNTKIEKKKTKKASELFAKISGNHKVEKNKETTNNIKEVDHRNKPQSSSALEKIKSATSSKQSDSGIENAYFAKVQSLLETWPTQSEYVGQKAMVRIYVKPTGAFDFKVKSKSNNLDFNLGLIDFLEQLKRFGLGSHKGGKTYEIEVEFTAKE